MQSANAETFCGPRNQGNILFSHVLEHDRQATMTASNYLTEAFRGCTRLRRFVCCSTQPASYTFCISHE